MASQVVLEVKNLSTNAGDIRDIGSICGSVRSPEKGNATHSSILAWEIPEQRSLAGYSPWGCKELDTIEQLNMYADCIYTAIYILL